MSFSNITTSSNIIDCSISLSGSHIAVLTAVGIDLYEWDFRSKTGAPPRKIASKSFDSEHELEAITRYRQIVIQGEHRIGIFSLSKSGSFEMTRYIMEGSNGVLVNDGEDRDFNSSQGGQLRGIYTDEHHEFIWCQTSAGTNCLNRSDLYITSAVHSSPQILVVQQDGQLSNGVNDEFQKQNDQISRQFHIFSLSRKGELYANDKLVTRGCTSFVSTNAHLIFTTSLHLLKFVHIGVSDGRCRKLFTDQC